MPRGVRGSVNYDVQIQKLDEKISRHTALLSELKSQRQDLISKKRDAGLQELYAYMQANDLSAEDIISQLNPVDDAVAAGSSTTEECV